ncbi:permease [Paenibacillus sp. MWE-103]|uniref:Permease n=1 Tax=Paenibacillus artemisiicola TaxID=1172618 RepID=A0ABS3W9Q6_9BACL|nr:permease [Paenibacillus artemisiicola]MBO7745057.1 permease [Paenibacillus artemisiicola]
MQTTVTAAKPRRGSGNAVIAASVAIIVALYLLSKLSPGAVFQNQKLQIIKMMFISVIIEALPFILVGVIVSALLEVFVPERTIRRLIPRNPLLGIVAASFIGIIFPICECGMVPAIRRLIAKGMPLYAATTFLVVGPILNPIVFWSTLTAFRGKPEIVWSRMGLAFLTAVVIGLIVHRFVKTDQLKPVPGGKRDHGHDHDRAHDHHHDHDHPHAHDHHHNHAHEAAPPRSLAARSLNKLTDAMSHAIGEFFSMGKYLIIGALLVGVLQAFVTRSSLEALGHGPAGSNLIMMGLGFLLSLCSTSDAFVAQSFTTTFASGALVAFMVLGPMLNLKGLLMMTAVFKTRFVLLYAALAAGFVYAGTWALGQFVLP